MGLEKPGRRLGYVRVSKASQDEAGQIIKLLEEGKVERKADLYIDKGYLGARRPLVQPWIDSSAKLSPGTRSSSSSWTG